MSNPLRLLAPALIPSWNFFDVIAPSPRVEYALSETATETPAAWAEFRPRPARVSPLAMLTRLFWNPRWNQSLFVTACAERLIDQPTAHSEDEIFRRLALDLPGDAAGWLAFRLAFVSRRGEAIEREVLFQAAPRRLETLR
jgi:hypothetical protein